MSVESENPVVVAIASPKGGVGKTMVTILLAGEFAALDYRVLVIDADPQGSAIRWRDNTVKANLPMERISVVAAGGRDTFEIQDTISRLIKTTPNVDIVLIDVQGTANGAMAVAGGFADLILIPTRPNIQDVSQAEQLANYLKRTKDTTPYRVVINAVSEVAKSNVAFMAAMSMIAKAGLPVINTALRDRPTFATAITAGTLYDMSDSSKSAQTARANARALCSDIVAILNEETA
jgi:chromosome partitioning protein